MALWPQDLTTITVLDDQVALVGQDMVNVGPGSSAPVLSAQVPAPGSVVSPPVASISFEVR